MSAPLLPVRRLAAAAVLLLAGCAVGPDFARPAPPTADGFTRTPAPQTTETADIKGGAAQHLVAGRDLPGEWWSLFRSPQITDLVARAIRANPDLAAAEATLRVARENTRAGQGALFPSISGGFSHTRQQVSLAAFGLGNGSALFSLDSASLNVSYTLDVFGGIRRQVEQLDAQAEYERFELEATYLTLAANVVNAAISEAATQAQIDATREILRLYRQELDVSQRRFELGGISRADVLQQQSSLAAAEATLPPLIKQLEQTRNQLAVYLGAQPAQFTDAPVTFASLNLPEELPLSLPSKLVEQRPDIRAYEALLHSATAGVGIATANMLPNVSLTAGYGYEGTTLPLLFTPTGLVWSLAQAIAQPVFEGGTLLHRRRAAMATVQVAAAQYSSTVNTAFKDVANALVSLDQDAQALHAQLLSERTAAESLEVARAQFSAGAGSYLSLLAAEQTFQNARLLLVAAQAIRFSDTVALFQALGGGWWNRHDVNADIVDCCGILP